MKSAKATLEKLQKNRPDLDIRDVEAEHFTLSTRFPKHPAASSPSMPKKSSSDPRKDHKLLKTLSKIMQKRALPSRVFR